MNIRHFTEASEAFVPDCIGQKIELTNCIINVTENIGPSLHCKENNSPDLCKLENFPFMVQSLTANTITSVSKIPWKLHSIHFFIIIISLKSKRVLIRQCPGKRTSAHAGSQAVCTFFMRPQSGSNYFFFFFLFFFYI